MEKSSSIDFVIVGLDDRNFNVELWATLEA